MAFQQKAAAENEIAAAKEQLNMFTQNIIEKTKLIEQLEQQAADQAPHLRAAKACQRVKQSNHTHRRRLGKIQNTFRKNISRLLFKTQRNGAGHYRS